MTRTVLVTGASRGIGAARQLIEQWGGVDVVVNNGRHIGPGLMDTILDTPVEQYPLFLMAHGVAPIRITQLLLPGMLERGGGTLVTVSSSAGYDFYPGSPRPGPRLARLGSRESGAARVAASTVSTRGVRVKPGATALTRMPSATKARAALAVRALSAALGAVGDHRRVRAGRGRPR
jgi:NADP-dependent 3-hydroxy acid dehydrogenase YdfG